MSIPEIEVMVIASVVAVACSLLGVFLVLKKMAMMSDAITHTILLGIVLGFFITHDLSSPFLIVGATLMGLATVYLIETLERTKLLSEESSIGVVFPLLFSIAIILITRYAGNVHLDTDSVLLGELAFAPLYRMDFLGISIPKSLFTMLIILAANVVFVAVFFKELKLSSFDALLSMALGFSPIVLNYALMALVSVTAVGAFEAVGSILVIAFMIGPAITAFLLTHDLKKLIFISSAFAVFNAVVGYQVARVWDVSIAGSMAVMTGLTFGAVFLFSKQEGFVSTVLRRKKQRKEFAELTVLFHLYNHENSDTWKEESGVFSMSSHLKWAESTIEKIIVSLEHKRYVVVEDTVVLLTDLGRQVSLDYYHSIFDR